MSFTAPLVHPIVQGYRAYQKNDTAGMVGNAAEAAGVVGLMGGAPTLASAAVHAFEYGKTLLASDMGRNIAQGIAQGATQEALNHYGPGKTKDKKDKLKKPGKGVLQTASDVLKHLSAPTRAHWEAKYKGKPHIGKRRRDKRGRFMRNRLPYSKNSATHEKMSHFHRAPASDPPSDITSRRAMREYLEQKREHLPVVPPRKPVHHAEGVFPFDEGIVGGDSVERVADLVPHERKTSLHKRQYLPYLGGQDKTQRWIQGMLGPGLRKHLGSTDEAVADALSAKDRRSYTSLFGAPNHFHEVSIAQVNESNLQRDLKEELRTALARPTANVPTAYALAGAGPQHMLKDHAKDQERHAAHVSHVAPPAASTNEAVPAHA